MREKIEKVLRESLPYYDFVHKTDEYKITKRALEMLADLYENEKSKRWQSIEDDSFSINM